MIYLLDERYTLYKNPYDSSRSKPRNGFYILDNGVAVSFHDQSEIKRHLHEQISGLVIGHIYRTSLFIGIG